MPRKPVTVNSTVIDVSTFRHAAGDLETHRQDAEQSIGVLEAFVISTEADRAFCLDLCRDIKRRHNDLEDKRKQVTQPLNAVIKEINGWFKPVTTALAQAEQVIKTKLLAYDAAILEANRKALETAAQAPTPQAAETALERIAPAPAPLPGASTKTTWALGVEAPEAVPRALCSPDLDKIKAALREALATTGQPPTIPGVRFWQEQTLAIRT